MLTYYRDTRITTISLRALSAQHKQVHILIKYDHRHHLRIPTSTKVFLHFLTLATDVEHALIAVKLLVKEFVLDSTAILTIFVAKQ